MQFLLAVTTSLVIKLIGLFYVVLQSSLTPRRVIFARVIDCSGHFCPQAESIVDFHVLEGCALLSSTPRQPTPIWLDLLSTSLRQHPLTLLLLTSHHHFDYFQENFSKFILYLFMRCHNMFANNFHVIVQKWYHFVCCHGYRNICVRQYPFRNRKIHFS